VATAKGENQDLALTVTLYIDPADVKELIGNDLDGHYIVADVKVEPKYGKEVAINRDDFQLRTDKDGEKAKPFAPSQIAGRGALIVHQEQQGRTTGAVGSPSSYPGNYPGGGYPPGGYPPGGYPYPNGGGAVAGVGNEDDAGTTAATVRNGAGDKENPIEQTLKDKVLPEKKTGQPVSGLLYFVMEKQKLKDLELTYGGKENRITLRFK
jgi:hypothetical protein